MQKKYDVIGDVRGMGLMNAMELVHPEDKSPAGEICGKFKANALKEGLFLLDCGADHNNIRLIPPLNVDEATIDLAFEIMDKAMEETLKG